MIVFQRCMFSRGQQGKTTQLKTNKQTNEVVFQGEGAMVLGANIGWTRYVEHVNYRKSPSNR